MRIGRQRENRETSPLRRKSVPDYTQRGTKMRVFGMVAALMVVLALADKARDPKTWNWLWQMDQSAEQAEPKFTNRLQPKELRTARDPAGTFVAAGEKDASAEEDRPTLTIDPVQRAWDQGWKDVYDRLDADRRALLFQMLHSGTSHAALDPERQTAAGELLAAVTTLWEDYQVVAFQSVAKLTGDDQAVWVDVLRQVNHRFSEQVRPALQGVIDGRALTESEEQALVGFQTTLLALTRTRIEDDTIFRPAEREIWFHELARVRDTSPEKLLKESRGQIAYLQLFNQPDDYRGQVITVAGTVKLAYRVQAPPNYLGIEQYYVFWLHPSGGPTSPIVVYALAAPPGFPPIKDKDADAATTKLHEELQVTGVFFKRWAYLAKDGDATYTAPLLIANVPTWKPAAPLLTAADRLPMTVQNIVLVAGATLALGLIVGLILYKVASRRGPDYAEPPFDTTALKGVKLKPTASEALRDLEREARGGKLTD
jgi:hypothetical protein